MFINNNKIFLYFIEQKFGQIITQKEKELHNKPNVCVNDKVVIGLHGRCFILVGL